MIDTILMGLFFGFFTLLYPFAPHFLVGFYTSLACNVLFYYILNRFIYPKVIYSNYFFKEYFLGILVVVIIFEIIGSFMLPFKENVCTFCDDYEELKNMSSIGRFYTYFGQFNQAFIGLLFLKMMIFYISWKDSRLYL